MTLLTALAAALIWVGRRAWRSGAWLEAVPVVVGMPWLGRVMWLARAALVGRAFWRADERASRPLRARREIPAARRPWLRLRAVPGPSRWRMASGPGRRPQRHHQVAERRTGSRARFPGCSPSRCSAPPGSSVASPAPPGPSPPSPAGVIRADLAGLVNSSRIVAAAGAGAPSGSAGGRAAPDPAAAAVSPSSR